MPEFDDQSSATTTTENQLADAFERFLRGRKYSRAFPRLDGIYREVPGVQGVADFVGVQSKDWKRKSKKLSEHLGALPRGPVAELLAALSRPMTKDAVLENSSYSKGVLLSVLSRLVEAGVVRRDESGTYRLSPRFSLPDFELYFFELKLSKWQRALAQAIQGKMYANKVFCVFPLSAEKVISKKRGIFEKMGVGVLLFDGFQMELSERVRARKADSARLAYKIDVLLRLAEIESRYSRIEKEANKSKTWNPFRWMWRYFSSAD